MVGKFFPPTLTRRQYLFRCMIVLIVFLTAFAVVELLVFGTTDANLQGIAGILFLVAILSAFLYNIFGLSIPRLRNAQISPSWVLLVFIPLAGILALFAMCAIARQKPGLKA